MKRKTLILSLLLFSTGLFSNEKVQEPNQEQKQAIFMMNYAQYVTYKLKTYNNILVLEDEYNNLNNNMNYQTIKDYQSVETINQLLDSLHEERKNHKNIERLKKVTEQKMNNALYNSIPQVTTIFAGGVSPVMLAINTVQTAGSMFMSYQQCKNQISQEFDDKMFEFQSITEDTLHEQYKNLNTFTFNLMKQYDISDEWRLNETELEPILNHTKDPDKQRAYKNLQDMSEGKYIQHFPMFWYHLGKTAYEAGDELGALFYLNRFEKENIEIFRYDTIAIDAYKCKITILLDQYLNNKKYESLKIPSSEKKTIIKNKNDTLEEILSKLTFIENNKLPNNWNDYYYCALVYTQLGDTKKAKNLLERNISELSSKIENQFIASAYLENILNNAEENKIHSIGTSDYDGLELSRALLNKLGFEKISFSSVKNQYKSNTQCLNEVFYQFGLTQTSEVINNSKEEIKKILISTDISSEDKLRINVKLPMQWMLSSNTELQIHLKKGYSANKIEKFFSHITQKKDSINDEKNKVIENNSIVLSIDEKKMKKLQKKNKIDNNLYYTSNKWKCNWAKEGYTHLSLIIYHPVYSIELLYPIEIAKAEKNVSPNAIRFDGLEYAL